MKSKVAGLLEPAGGCRMKHNIKITLIILLMFLVTQFLGLFVINYYLQPAHILPYGMGVEDIPAESTWNVLSIVIAFIFAIGIFFLFRKLKSKVILKLWFFIVVVIALGLFFTALLNLPTKFAFLGLIFALPLALSKVYDRNFVSHNLSELMIYPGIAAVFVPLLNFWGMIILLVLISVYDMWAVWQSKIMQKMARYQMDELKVFSGFLVPYLTKAQREKVKAMKSKSKKGKPMKVNMAVLGGGDVVFPIITAGVMMKLFNPIISLFVIGGALLGLAILMSFSEKKKFYPAMPFITGGIFLGLLIALLFGLF
jgi:presenilin-like A22 family membrane protease